MKKAISILLAILLVFIALPISTLAEETSPVEIKLSSSDLLTDCYKTIQTALNKAKNNATDKSPYKIYVPDGTYCLKGRLQIYSNTGIYLNEKTILSRDNSFISKSMSMIIVGNTTKKDDSTKQNYSYGYNGYKNIVISGGYWENKNDTSCIMRFAHCKNLTVSNLTMSNVKNNHHIEIAAVNGFYMSNCTLKNNTIDIESSGEALQIDIIHSWDHFPGFGAYDDTPCKNVYVNECNFENLYSGVGTRSGVVGSYFDNINIINNTFTNISEKAIACFNYINSNISYNTINSSKFGVVFENFPSYDVSSRIFSSYDSSKNSAMVYDCNSTIFSNKITITSSTDKNGAVWVYGEKVSSTMASSNNIPLNNYLVSGLTIDSNLITSNTNNSRAIRLYGLKHSSIKNNTIKSNSKANFGINAFNVSYCYDLSIKNNYTSGFYNSVSLYNKASKIVIKNNTIKNTSNSAVNVATNSSANIQNNECQNCKNIYFVNNTNYSNKLGDTSVKQIVGGKGVIVVQFKKINNASSYNIYRSISASGPYYKIATTSSMVFVDPTVKKGTKYYYKICPSVKINNSKILGCAGKSASASSK